MNEKKRDWGDVYDNMVKQLKQNSEFYVNEGKKKKAAKKKTSKKKRDHNTTPNPHGRFAGVGNWYGYSNGTGDSDGGDGGGDGGGGGE